MGHFGPSTRSGARHADRGLEVCSPTARSLVSTIRLAAIHSILPRSLRSTSSGWAACETRRALKPTWPAFLEHPVVGERAALDVWQLATVPGAKFGTHPASARSDRRLPGPTEALLDAAGGEIVDIKAPRRRARAPNERLVEVRPHSKRRYSPSGRSMIPQAIAPPALPVGSVR